MIFLYRLIELKRLCTLKRRSNVCLELKLWHFLCFHDDVMFVICLKTMSFSNIFHIKLTIQNQLVFDLIIHGIF